MTTTPTPTAAKQAAPKKISNDLVANNPFVEFVKLYKHNPVLFVREVLNTEPDQWQIEFLNSIASGNRRISVRSGHGVGKSTAASWAMIWYLFLRFPVKVVVTAPTSSQLYDALFAEVKRWVKVLPPMLAEQLDVKQDRIEVIGANEEAFISARTSRAEQPEALQGVHSDHVMLVGDEASGIPEKVFEAASGSMSGHNAVTLLLGNPVRSSGFFYDTHNRLAGDWVTMKVSCADSPRVSEAYIEEMKARYGEESNAYRIRVLGEFPKSDEDTVIPMELLDLAMNRDVEASPYASLVWGLDVARFGSDRSPAMGTTYRNLKAELWYKAKSWLEQRDCRLPKDELLIAELATVRYSFTSNGKIQIEGKDEIRKRGLASPDKADAFCLTFASDAVIGMMGSKASTKWSQPLKRNLSRVA